MNRREALKGLGLSLGYIAVTPTALSLLQSCKKDAATATDTWTPVFFTKEQGAVIKNLTDLILPKSGDLPGAGDVDVAQFIDLYVAEIADKKGQENYKKSINNIIEALGKPVNKITTEDYDKLLAKYLKATKEEKEAFNNNEKDKAVYDALLGLRDTSIWGYKNSKLVGTEVLAYDPVPGAFNGCISLEEATGGRLWSL